jgi:DNA invertase Pin-like site-specific DNA recombinase
MESGVDFVAADCPNDDRMMLQMRAVFAEEEAQDQLTYPGRLGGRQARDVKVGGYRGAPPPDARVRAASLATRQEAAVKNAADYADTIADIREAGITSANGIAAELNRRRVTTPRGGLW